MGDTKRTVAEILGPIKGEKSVPGDGAGDVLKAIAGELIDAVHAKDSAAVADALRAAHAECGSPAPETEET